MNNKFLKQISYWQTIFILLIVLLVGGTLFAATINVAASPTDRTTDREITWSAFSSSNVGTIYLPLVFEESGDNGDTRFAVIGDYGSGSQDEADVAVLVKSWNPDLIITTGDNNYPDGAADTIDENIGQFFHEFIFPYTGTYGPGALENRFFPTLGNHDWHTTGAQPYLDYFNLPGNERYYDFTWGPVHFFALDSDSEEPDGVDSGSIQAAWLQSQLASSTQPWQIVYMHHSPYSSGEHGPANWMQWPFVEWGVDVVISGHDHTYERISRDGINYFVNGIGGSSTYNFQDIVEGSQVRFNEDFGAMLVGASGNMLRIQFITRQGVIVDQIVLVKP